MSVDRCDVERGWNGRWNDDIEPWMCDRTSSWFRLTCARDEQSYVQCFSGQWKLRGRAPCGSTLTGSGDRVDNLLMAACLLALCPSGGAHSHWAITADWHPDFNPYTSQLWRDRPPLLCQRGLRAPLCEAGSFQPCDPWRREKRPKRVSGLTLAPEEHF